jgi:hypothetical protein
VLGYGSLDLLLARIAARVAVALRNDDVGQRSRVRAHGLAVNRPRNIAPALANENTNSQVLTHIMPLFSHLSALCALRG